jgi:hypothetical protein
MDNNNVKAKCFEELFAAYQRKYTHWRFGQFISNFADWLKYEKCIDIFYLEDERFPELIKEYAKEGNF